MNKVLKIKSSLITNGISINVKNKDYALEYPHEIWTKTPEEVKIFLQEHITVANTHYLPLMLDYSQIDYDIPIPFFEPFLFKNQLYDMLYCEDVDKTFRLKYLQKFYNWEYKFKKSNSQILNNINIQNFKHDKPVAIIPFSFGKESLATLGLCLELDIEPILVYVQEPSQPYEEMAKKEMLNELSSVFKIKSYYIKNDPGLFRYGRAFNLKKQSEIGWGTEATTFLLLMLPFIFAYGANMVLFGNEYTNNESYIKNGWRVFSSYDQHPDWVFQQNNMLSSITANKTQVKTMLEPLEESSVFYILHNRYPKLAKYQFSCHARQPLTNNSHWCHVCSKCWFNNALALSFGLDNTSLGFKKDFIYDTKFFEKQIKPRIKDDPELQFIHIALKLRGIDLGFNKIKNLHQWNWYKDRYTILKPAIHLPNKYIDKLDQIFKKEVESMKTALP